MCLSEDIDDNFLDEVPDDERGDHISDNLNESHSEGSGARVVISHLPYNCPLLFRRRGNTQLNTVSFSKNQENFMTQCYSM